MQIKHLVNGEWIEVRQNKLAEAFDHAKAHGSQFDKDLYKVATNVQGHVTQATPVTKTDLTNYGLLDTNAVAPVYSDNTTYSTGEFCIYQGKLYKALQDVDHEEFNPSKWEESNILTATVGGGTVITGEADWNAQQGDLGYIKNKPDIPSGQAVVLNVTDIPYIAQDMQSILQTALSTGFTSYLNAPFFYSEKIIEENIANDMNFLIDFLTENNGHVIYLYINDAYQPITYRADNGFVSIRTRDINEYFSYDVDVNLMGVFDLSSSVASGAKLEVYGWVSTNNTSVEPTPEPEPDPDPVVEQ